MTLSPLFEARRSEYYERLLAVSTDGAWDDFVRFFALGLREPATATRHQMLELVKVQTELKEVIRASALRSRSATSRRVSPFLTDEPISSSAAHGSRVLDVVDADAYKRRFFAPRVLDVLTSGGGS